MKTAEDVFNLHWYERRAIDIPTFGRNVAEDAFEAGRLAGLTEAKGIVKNHPHYSGEYVQELVKVIQAKIDELRKDGE